MSLLLCGCGPLVYKAEYSDVTLTSHAPDMYTALITGEQYATSQIQHEEVVRLWVRFDDGAAFELPEIPEAEAESRASYVDRESHPGLTMYSLGMCGLNYRDGKLCGATLHQGVGVSKVEQGPFVEFPISAQEMRDLLGEPHAESTFRGTPRWN
jgi:hypothetical protein